jgi:hypothetical protein
LPASISVLIASTPVTASVLSAFAQERRPTYGGASVLMIASAAKQQVNLFWRWYET